MPYTLQIGRIWLPTLHGDYGLTAGDGLEAVGALAFGGESRPRDLKITLPIHGENEDADPRVVADRLRRQLEALLENEAARLPGLFMRWRPFLDRDAWLAIGGGDFADTDGGPSFGEYSLELDVKRAGTSATLRPGRRVRSIDRRLSSAPRDYRGSIYSSDFAALSSLPLHFLPPGATDVLGARGVLLTAGARKALGGSVGVLANRPADEVITFERPAIALGGGGGDVVITDRRGRPDWTPRAAGPRNPSFDGASGEGSVARWPTASSSDAPAVTEFRASEDWTARPESRFSAYFKITRTAGASILLRSETGIAGVPVTPAGKLAVRAVYNGLQIWQPTSTVRVRVYWYTAAGASSATATTDVQFNTDLGLPNLGRIDFAALADVPADAAFAAFALVTVAPTGAAATWEGYLDDVMLEDVTGLGLTKPRPYADGEDANRVWLDVAGDSHHSLSQQAAGHDEVYGPSQLLDSPIADVPVIENGLTRVRYSIVNGFPGFALDTWDATLARYVERGRINAWQDYPAGTRNLYNALVRSSVVEWTPERAVLRVSMLRAGEGRADVYITLQRGWTGPRVEVYARRFDGVSPGVLIGYSPAGAAGDSTIVMREGLPVPNGAGAVWAEPNQTFANPAMGIFGASIPSGIALNAVLVQPVTGPGITLAVVQAAAELRLRNDTTAYGDLRNGVSVSGGVGVAYVSVHFAATPSVHTEAETASGSATALPVADAAANGGNAIEDTQTAETAATVSVPMPAGLYAVWARVRVVTAGATGSFRARGSAAAAAIFTTTSLSYVWLYLGEVSTVSNPLTIRGWRSAGTGAIRIDRVAWVPLERRDATDPAYDGLRDHAQAELADARQDLALVGR